MATAVFKETVSIKQAVSIINGMDAGKFPRLLSRILQKLHLKAEQSFNEEEEEKLQAAFLLDKQSLKLVLETISFILEQAVYHNLKTPVFRQQLENIHLEQSKIEAFASVWENSGPETVEKFRQRTFTPKKSFAWPVNLLDFHKEKLCPLDPGHTCNLETTAWQLNLQMAQSTQAKMKSPQAVLELGVSTEDTKNLEKIFVEFNHKELVEFYNKLETIQAQLDSLT
ncbi:COMM domain-containing protein 10 isoform X3 [Phyllobates terribilis]|uniref:COMM domain-containing protein 10 isoform X3 n=1 Tax=Phyllobates terribilis TaxID=111132 RepID=UPI003CCAD62F